MSIPYTEHDRAIVEAVQLSFRNAAGSIKFQFPPKILSDNRKGTWDETELLGVEPVAVFTGSGPREFALNWTYIVESTDGLGGGWDIDAIRENVNKVRGYFGSFKSNGSSRAALIVDFKFAAITGKEAWTCRIKAIDVKHSENLVGDPKFCYPLRTDITIDLRLWTKAVDGEDAGNFADVVDLPLRENPSLSDFWY